MNTGCSNTARQRSRSPHPSCAQRYDVVLRRYPATRDGQVRSSFPETELSDISQWRPLDPSREPPLPIDDLDGGCDDQPTCPTYRAWTRQHPALQIEAEDAISDSGAEIYRLLEQRQIENIIVMGVHTNYCVLGRSFGIRRLVGLGKNIALMRDLTDSLYNPRMRPYVSHFRGYGLGRESYRNLLVSQRHERPDRRGRTVSLPRLRRSREIYLPFAQAARKEDDTSNLRATE